MANEHADFFPGISRPQHKTAAGIHGDMPRKRPTLQVRDAVTRRVTRTPSALPDETIQASSDAALARRAELVR